MAIALTRRRLKNIEGAKIEVPKEIKFESSFCVAGENKSPLSRERGQTVPEFFGRNKNLIGFSCQEKSFFVCWSQKLGHHKIVLVLFDLFYSTVITPHGT